MVSRLVQVAGIQDLEEAKGLEALGVEWLGFPLRLDFHQPDMNESETKTVIRALRPRTKAVLITYETDSAKLLDLLDFLGTNYVQLHADWSPAATAKLRIRRPDLFIIKSLVVGLYEHTRLHELAAAWDPHVDAFITDTFDPKSGAKGATGMTHDWQVSAALCRALKRPLILAGGLRPENLAAAIEAVRPAGVDVHTGVEDALGRKDAKKVSAFLNTAETAFNALI